MPSDTISSLTPPGARPRLADRVMAHAAGARRAVLLAAAMAALGACTRPDAFAPACPQLALLADGADLTRFNGAGRDITDLVIDAHITRLPASCKWADDRHKKVEAAVMVAMALNRGPAMPGRTVDVPYFIAVSEDDNILDKQVYALRAEFPANIDRLNLTSDEITLLIPVTADKSAAAYKITVSFQLTPEELAQNRTRVAH